MATYIYMVKSTLRHNEDDSGRITHLQALTAHDYVEAMRAGPGYGTEPSDPRGNLVPLQRYVEQQWAPPNQLRLSNTNGTRFALAIFGMAAAGRSKVANDLRDNATWQKIEDIIAPVVLKGVFASGKFGTDHSKYLLLLASKDFSGFPSDGKTLSSGNMGMITRDSYTAKARSLETFLS